MIMWAGWIQWILAVGALLAWTMVLGCGSVPSGSVTGAADANQERLWSQQDLASSASLYHQQAAELREMIYFSNIDWDVVEESLGAGTSSHSQRIVQAP